MRPRPQIPDAKETMHCPPVILWIRLNASASPRDALLSSNLHRHLRYRSIARTGPIYGVQKSRTKVLQTVMMIMLQCRRYQPRLNTTQECT